MVAVKETLTGVNVAKHGYEATAKTGAQMRTGGNAHIYGRICGVTMVMGAVTILASVLLKAK